MVEIALNPEPHVLVSEAVAQRWRAAHLHPGSQLLVKGFYKVKIGHIGGCKNYGPPLGPLTLGAALY